jgi:hypothetical protein
MEQDSNKRQCQHCGEFYSKGYLSTHIEKQHGITKAEQKTKREEIKEQKRNKEERRSYHVPQDFDPMSISLEDIDSPDISKQIFSDNKKRNQPELAVQKKLEKKYNGTHKTTPAGIIDVWCQDGLIVEAKSWDNWKAAIGQLMAYGYYYPNHMLKVHFFGKIPDDEKRIVIITICTHYRIAVDWEK